MGGVQVTGEGGGAGAGVVEEDGGGVDGGCGVAAEIVAEEPGAGGAGQVAGDLGEGLAEPGGGQGQGGGDVAGDGRWSSPALVFVVQFRPRIASAAVRARVIVSSLVSWSRSMTCRKSSTAVALLLLLPGAVAGLDQGGVADLGLQRLVVAVREDAQVVDAGRLGFGAGLAVAGTGLGVPRARRW